MFHCPLLAQLYKMDPDTFDTWCAILRRVPDSVLWLLRFPPYGEARVKSEAARRGVDPARVIFTDVAAKPLHIRRRCGDGGAGRAVPGREKAEAEV
jgi:predicted O-linked N-acetylglucosamine transferase (SPINDLY family)